MPDLDITALLDTLDQRTGADDLEELCFRLGIDPANLAGDTKHARFRSLLRRYNQADDLPTLLTAIRRIRPDIPLPDLPAPPPSLPPSTPHAPPSTSPAAYGSVFISYSSRDEDFATRLHDDLVAHGVTAWFAPEDLRIGDRIRDTLHREIGAHNRLLLILSEHSVTSDWVADEVETAFARERRDRRTVLFPIRLDDAVMTTDEAWAETVRIQRHIGDFRNWQDPAAYQKALARVLRDLRPPLASEPSDPSALVSDALGPLETFSLLLDEPANWVKVRGDQYIYHRTRTEFVIKEGKKSSDYREP